MVCEPSHTTFARRADFLTLRSALEPLLFLPAVLLLLDLQKQAYTTVVCLGQRSSQLPFSKTDWIKSLDEHSHIDVLTCFY